MTTSKDPRRRFALPIWDAHEQADQQESPAVHDESTVRFQQPDDAETVLCAHGEPAATVHFTKQPTDQPTKRPTAHPTELLTEQLAGPLTGHPTKHVTTPLAQPGAPGAAREHRFGPGVPALAAATDSHLASLWHGTVSRDEQPGDGSGRPPRRRRRLLGGWLVPLVVLIAVLAYLGWQRFAPGLAVTGVAVRTDPVGPECGGTAVITGTLKTNGRPGEVTYRWKRSDGTVSDTLHQHVPGGSRHTDAVLRWSFNGHGVMRATATLEVLSPDATTASTAFTYTCR